MDRERLIDYIYERKPLWDSKCKDYHNRDLVKKLWLEVARELRITTDMAKSKWRGLRDHFRRELSKLKKGRSSDAGGIHIQPNWPFFESMLFLKDIMSTRNTKGNKPEYINIYEENVTDDFEDTLQVSANSCSPTAALEQCDPQEVDNAFVQPCASGTGLKRRMRNSEAFEAKKPRYVYESILDVEEEKLFQFKKNSPVKEDDDYHFLMSLLPYLRTVPAERKMHVRMKLQQVFIDEDELPRTEV